MFVSLPTDYSHCALKVVRLGAFLNTFILWHWSVRLTWKQRCTIFQRSLPVLNYQEHTKRNNIIQSPDTELHASEFTTQSLDDIHSILWLSSSQCFYVVSYRYSTHVPGKKNVPLRMRSFQVMQRVVHACQVQIWGPNPAICCRPCLMKIAEGVSLAELSLFSIVYYWNAQIVLRRSK